MGLDGYHLHYQKSPTSSWESFHSATQLIDIPFHSVELGLSSLPNVRYQRICQNQEDHIPKADTVYVAISSQLASTSRRHSSSTLTTHQVSYIAMAFEFFASIVSHFIFCRRGRDFFNGHSLADIPAAKPTKRDTDCSKL